MSKHDIDNIDDIKLFVDDFYGRVRQDELLSPIFFEHIPGDWQPHLNRMYQFWNTVLFGVKDYVGNPFAKHAHMPLAEAHFQRWLQLFCATVDSHFDGPVAADAKRRGQLMALTFLSRMNPDGFNPNNILV